MRLLGVLDLAPVVARLGGQVLGAVADLDLGPGTLDRLVGEERRVGAHVGDVPVLVEALGDGHGPGRGEAELAPRLLLEGRRREGGLRALRERLRLDRVDPEAGVPEVGGELRGRGLVEQRHVGALGEVAGRGVEVPAGGEPPPAQGDEGGRELGGAGREDPVEVEVGGGAERHPGPFPLHDEPAGDALDPAGRGRATSPAAGDHRHLVAEEPVELAASLLSLDEAHVEVAGARQGGLDGGSGDLVEDEAFDRHRGAEHLEDVPGDGLAFPVLVGREEHLVGVAERLFQLLHDVAFLVDDNVDRLEVVVHVDAEPADLGVGDALGHLLGAARQIADVAAARENPELGAAEESLDRFRLRRRLDDYERLRHIHVLRVRSRVRG